MPALLRNSRNLRPPGSRWAALPLEQIREGRNRFILQMASWTLIAIIAVVDWWTKPYVSLGFLYLFPIMFMATFLPRWAVVVLATCCAVLTELFSSLEPSFVRLSFEMLAMAGCGLFVTELARNRRLTLQAETRLKALVETSPAGIMTVDEHGFIELANESAIKLLAPREEKLVGEPIAAFLPELHHTVWQQALRWKQASPGRQAPQLRASMQCQGHKGNDELFTADVWFSTYQEGTRAKLAAIVTEIAEEVPAYVPAKDFQPAAVTARESAVLGLLVEGLANKEIAARMEVSESLIKNVLQQLFAKTNVRTRAQLVRIAVENYRDEIAPASAGTGLVCREPDLTAEGRRMLSAYRAGARRSSIVPWSADTNTAPNHLSGQPA